MRMASLCNVTTASCLLYARCDQRQANQTDVVAPVADQASIGR